MMQGGWLFSRLFFVARDINVYSRDRLNNLLIIALLLVVSSAPLLTLSFPYGHDWIFELVRVAEFRTALLHGQLAPYWGENLYGGFGSPIFLFYAPLFSLITSSLVALTDSIVSAGALTLIIVTLAGLVFMYLFLDEFLRFYGINDNRAIRIGLYLFALNPYLLSDKFFRNANAEYTALCLTPMVLYGAVLIARQPRLGFVILALGMALTILSHNLTALVSFAAVTLMIALLYGAKRPKQSLQASIGLLLGLGLSAFFWLPALAYKSFVQITQITEGKFDFHAQYKPLLSSFGYQEFYTTGALAPILLLASLGLVHTASKNSTKTPLIPAAYSLLLVAGVFLLLQLPLTIPIWESVPFLKLFQFPWRMMGPLSIAVASTATLIVVLVSHRWPLRHLRTLEMMALLLCLLNALPHLLDVKKLPEEQIAHLFTSEMIQHKRLPATVVDEYLPVGSNKELSRAKRAYSAIYNKPQEVTIEKLILQGTGITFQANVVAPTQLTLARWYFPVWFVDIDSEKADVFPDANGLLSVKLPAGIHQVAIYSKPPLLRQYGNWISVTSILLLTCYTLITTVMFRRKIASSY